MIANKEVHTARGATALLADSVSFVTEAAEHRIVVCASHGGASSGEYASGFDLDLIVFNDAGVGKDDAGIQALRILEARGVAACAVSHDSARIGEVADVWGHGVMSHANAVAASTIRPGMSVQEAVDSWSSRTRR